MVCSKFSFITAEELFQDAVGDEERGVPGDSPGDEADILPFEHLHPESELAVADEIGPGG